MILRITICITTVGCGCCISIVTVSGDREIVTFAIRSLISSLCFLRQVTTSWDYRLLLYLAQRTITNVIPRQDFPRRLLEIYHGCQRETFSCTVSGFCRRSKTRRPEKSPRQPIAARQKKIPRVLKIWRPFRKLTCIPLDSMKALEHTTAAADPSAVGADMASVIGLHMVFDSLIYFKGISFLRHAYGLCTLCLWFL